MIDAFVLLYKSTTFKVPHNWPELGEPNKPLIEYLINQKRSDNKLILWTCRAGEALEKAVFWCREHQLEFDAINDNLLEIVEMYA